MNLNLFPHRAVIASFVFVMLVMHPVLSQTATEHAKPAKAKPVRVLVAYDSLTGNTGKMAEEAGAGRGRRAQAGGQGDQGGLGEGGARGATARWLKINNPFTLRGTWSMIRRTVQPNISTRLVETGPVHENTNQEPVPV